ncbi:hypothetical protein Aph01nite_06910 [Acrocarpospora phusangensis]|uniref:DUF742 domain-containing protein n=1 Tax=Acrocarpospora phusangensis TaxID=1070424 RepID=A0A919UI76_9ACTN|nr:DUF742 domain-containing protein [Acrocarpospora phusangensis]GIH22381.1 hypothetical protein Aph01nite_06910 [Acrocarpospora phusangensis]
MTEERPLLRPYTLTRGRARPAGPDFDLVTIIRALPSGPVTGLPPEQLRILRACQTPASVADIASDVGLSLNVVRVLLGDLREQRLIAARPPATVAHMPEERILREVIQGLHAL